MNKLKENSEIQQEEFDRSICMTFFGNYRTSIKRIEKRFGIDTAYQVQSAIIDYGLYGIRPTDEDILILVSETVFDVIDKSQAKRARSFSGEDLEMSKKIIRSHLDRPDLSQDKISKLLGISKGKVNKTLRKYRNGEYEGIINFDDNNDNDSVNDYDGDYDRTDRDCLDRRDRLSEQSTETASPTTESTTPTPSTTELSEIEIYDRKIEIIKLFKKRIKLQEIAKRTGYEYGFISETIDDYMSEYKLPDKPKEIKTDIQLMDGSYLDYTKEELFNLATNNGNLEVDDIPWDILKDEYIIYGIHPLEVNSILDEFEAKLLKKHKKIS